MTKTTMPLSELLEKHDEGDFLRTVAEAVLQLIMETDVEGVIGAGRHERAEGRITYRNGYRDRPLDTRLGTLNLRVPKLRQGLLLPRLPRAAPGVREGARGRDPRGMDRRRLHAARGRAGAGHGVVWHLEEHRVEARAEDIDDRVGEFLNRPLAGDWPYLWLDATYLKVRQGGRIVSIAAIIAVAVNTDGRREIIGLGTGPSEAETFWTDFLRGLKARGLDGVKLVISDAHTGLKAAIARVFDGEAPSRSGGSAKAERAARRQADRALDA